jgi:hypothetical protein
LQNPFDCQVAQSSLLARTQAHVGYDRYMPVGANDNQKNLTPALSYYGAFDSEIHTDLHGHRASSRRSGE